jgi:hypothetical protein
MLQHQQPYLLHQKKIGDEFPKQSPTGKQHLGNESAVFDPANHSTMMMLLPRRWIRHEVWARGSKFTAANFWKKYVVMYNIY